MERMKNGFGRIMKIGKGIWLSKPLVKFSFATNGFGLVRVVNKLVRSPIPPIFDSLNILQKYKRIKNFLGLNEIIIMNGLIIPAINLACICSLILFVSTFLVLILLHIRSDKDHRSSTYQKIKNIPMSQYIEFTFTSSKIGMAGFVGTFTIKALIVVVCKDSLYKSIQQTSCLKDDKIYLSTGLKKTLGLSDSIKLTKANAIEILKDMYDFKSSQYHVASVEYPALTKRTAGKYCHNIMMKECKSRLNMSVESEGTIALIDSGILEVSEEVRLYFLGLLLSDKKQLRICYKLLLP